MAEACLYYLQKGGGSWQLNISSKWGGWLNIALANKEGGVEELWIYYPEEKILEYNLQKRWIWTASKSWRSLGFASKIGPSGWIAGGWRSPVLLM